MLTTRALLISPAQEVFVAETEIGQEGVEPLSSWSSPFFHMNRAFRNPALITQWSMRSQPGEILELRSNRGAVNRAKPA